MKHTGDYELDEINMLEQECADLEEENKKLKETIKSMKIDTMYDMKDINALYEENKKLKEELAKYKKQHEHSMWFSDFWGYVEWLYD